MICGILIAEDIMNRKIGRTLRNLCFAICIFISLTIPASALIEVKSSAFKEGTIIPKKYTGDGENVSIPISWHNIPEDTESFLIIMDDPDAPTGDWIHWLLYNIPENIRSLDENIPKNAKLSNGSMQGINDYKTIGYGGPTPPPGPEHRYVITVHALDTTLDVDPDADRSEVLNAAEGHVLDKGQLIGVYGRKAE